METEKSVKEMLNAMDDETLKQFCYETFNHRFFKEFFDLMCCQYSGIWRMVTNKCLDDAEVTEREINDFNA